MDWSSETVLEFIELMREETAIWDRRGNSNQNKLDKSEAWARIQKKFSMKCSVDEMKRKRNCLMTAYRDYLKKIKDSSNSSLNHVYKPSWFAFDAINSFMAPKYGFENLNLEVENQNSSRERGERWSRDSDINSPSLQTESETSQHTVYLQNFRKRRSPVVQSHPKRQMNENVILFRENDPTENEGSGNECDLYGRLLSEKLKRMSDTDRLVVMNEIDNLVFKHLVKAKSRIKTELESDASTRQNYITPSGSGIKIKNKMTMLGHSSSDEE